MLQRALSLFQAGEVVEALDIARQAAALAPNNPQVELVARKLASLTMDVCTPPTSTQDRKRARRLNDRGARLMNGGDLNGAIGCFDQAIQTDAKLHVAHANLAEAKRSLGQLTDALEHLATATKLAPDNHDYQCQMGHTLRDAGRIDEAKACFEVVEAAAPAHTEALVGIASCLDKAGDPKAALVVLQPLVESAVISPNLAAVFARLCRQQKRPADGVPVLQRAIDRGGASLERVLLLHALAECFDAMGATNDAFEAAMRANRLRTETYIPADFARMADETIGAFPFPDPRALHRAQVNTSRQVLIVGFPRSGTSLVEQIIASHPKGHGAGERAELPLLATALSRHAGDGDHWAEGLNKCNPADLDEMARFYTSRVNEGAGDALRVADKLPDNTAYLGIAARVLPQARIIHCVRSPTDTCLSAYFKNFQSAYAFSTRLDWLAHHYVTTQRLMAHWKQVLPNSILEVQYESLVDDPEAEFRRIMEFVGLPWDSAVLNFHLNRRLNNTASYNQVRQPIYRSSVGRADAYSEWLRPLTEIFEASHPR